MVTTGFSRMVADEPTRSHAEPGKTSSITDAPATAAQP